MEDQAILRQTRGQCSWKEHRVMLEEKKEHWIVGCFVSQYTRLSVMQADRVLAIITASWQDNMLVSAAEVRRTSRRVRVSKPPEAKKLSWTQPVKKPKRQLAFIHGHFRIPLHTHITNKKLLKNKSFCCFDLQLLATVMEMKEHMGWRILVQGREICWSHVLIVGKAATQIRWASSVKHHPSSGKNLVWSNSTHPLYQPAGLDSCSFCICIVQHLKYGDVFCSKETHSCLCCHVSCKKKKRN